jgi:DNA polymerase-3 subunit gamma/tau
VFENLLAQSEAIEALTADLAAGRLPPAVLFSGPPASGKTTAALELARFLSCTGASSGEAPRAPWNCACPSCSRHRLLVHPDLLLLGPRSFPEEIPAAHELLGRAPGPATAYFFARSARKLARRFDALLYEGEETRLAKAAPLLRELEEELDLVAPGRALPGGLAPGATEAAERADRACAKLEAFVPDAPPVFMIRNVEFWARLAPLGSRKTVVIENADRMLEGSRNALLKILEEPPDSVRFVLLSSRRSALTATILSRTRNYSFAARDAAGTALVIERVFRSSEPAASVEAFLAARRPFPPAAARERARAFLGAALASRAALEPRLAQPLEALARRAEVELGTAPARARALADLMDATQDFGQRDERLASSFTSFLAALSELLSSLLREEGMDTAGIDFIQEAAGLIREAASDWSTFNRSPGLLAESLMYQLAAAKSPPAGGRSEGPLA